MRTSWGTLKSWKIPIAGVCDAVLMMVLFRIVRAAFLGAPTGRLDQVDVAATEGGGVMKVVALDETFDRRDSIRDLGDIGLADGDVPAEVQHTLLQFRLAVTEDVDVLHDEPVEVGSLDDAPTLLAAVGHTHIADDHVVGLHVDGADDVEAGDNSAVFADDDSAGPSERHPGLNAGGGGVGKRRRWRRRLGHRRPGDRARRSSRPPGWWPPVGWDLATNQVSSADYSPVDRSGWQGRDAVRRRVDTDSACDGSERRSR